MKAYFNRRVATVFLLSTLIGGLYVSIAKDYNTCLDKGYSNMTCSK